MAGRSQHLKENDKLVAKVFGKRLYMLRADREISLEQVGKAISVSHQEVSAYERGTRRPSISVLIALSTYFDTSVDYLLGLEPLGNGFSNDDPREKMKDYVKVENV